MLGRSSGELLLIRPDRALIDPSANYADFVARQRRSFAFGRHLAEILIDSGDHSHQPAVAALASEDLRSAIAAVQRPLLLVQSQPALLMLLAMAREAVLLQQRQYIRRELNLSAR